MVFLAMLTQWRNSGFGATGLDYNVLPFVMKLHQIPEPEWRSVFEDIRVLEDAALETMKKLADQERKKRRNRHG